MSDEPHAAQPGWYPTPDGGQRYWNGSAWLDLPNPATPTSTRRRRPQKKFVVIAAVLLGLLGIAGITSKLVHDSNVRAEQEAAVTAANEAAQREADRIAAAAAEREEKDDAERLTRTLSVSGIEGSVKTMAEEHVTKGIVDGPVISVTCSPVSGGSTDDLTETTTVFQCFAATEDIGDGRMRGYNYHATMNWSTGNYTYGFGAP